MLTKYLVTLLLVTTISRSWAWPIRMQRSRHVAPTDHSYARKRVLPDNGHQMERTQLKQKRLMGIFRCNGWGPGCTHFNDPVHSAGTKGSIGKSLDITLPGRSRYGGWSRHGNFIFEPFFTLTSGR